MTHIEFEQFLRSALTTVNAVYQKFLDDNPDYVRKVNGKREEYLVTTIVRIHPEAEEGSTLALSASNHDGSDDYKGIEVSIFIPEDKDTKSQAT